MSCSGKPMSYFGKKIKVLDNMGGGGDNEFGKRRSRFGGQYFGRQYFGRIPMFGKKSIKTLPAEMGGGGGDNEFGRFVR